jgi:hypothetical protein
MRVSRGAGLGVVVGVIALALVACATFSQDAYRSLVVSQQTYDTTLSVMGDLYKAGKLNDVQKQRAIDIGIEYKAAHNSAVAALLLYETSDQTTEAMRKAAYQKAAADAAAILARLVAYAATFTGGK